jgi:hypothetical protein
MMLSLQTIRPCFSRYPLGIIARRYLSNPPPLEAFLEAPEAHQGIACLFLNRPKSKNAISMKLLKV